SNNYFETSLRLDRLDISNGTFPNIPQIQWGWKNRIINQKIIFSMYENYLFDVIIERDNNQHLSFNDFKNYKKYNEIEIFLMDGKDVQEKFLTYLNILHKKINEELSNVLKGKEWLDIPFDWQNQK